MDEEKPAPEPAVEPKVPKDERTFVETFITKAKPLDWMGLKEETSYPVPLPSLLMFFQWGGVVLSIITVGLFVPIIMLDRYLTITKPKNWKRHLSFILMSVNFYFILAPVFYWYFYRKQNVVKYYKQFED